MTSWMLAAVLALTLLVAPQAARLAAAPGEVVLVVPITNEPKTLSPDWQADTGGYSPTGNIFSHLVVMDWGVVKGTPAYGDLAERWTSDSQGRVYTFHLRRNARWHDGRPVTSADVKYTFDTILARKYPLRAYLGDVKEIRTPNPATVVIELSKPNVAFVPLLAQASNWFGKIIPQHLYEGKDWESGDIVSRPIGSGPFKFVEWVKGSHITLAANDNYFLGRPKVDRLVFRFIRDASVAYAEFMAGKFPYLPYDYAPPFAEISTKLMKDSSLKVVFTPSIYSRDIYLNMRRKPLDDQKVRDALAYAVDRSSMNQHAFFGLWKPSLFAGIEALPTFLNRDARFPGYNTVRAGQLLDEAGLKRGPDGWRFRLSVTNPIYSDTKAIAEVLVEQLRKVGINARWDQYDQATWWTKVNKGDFEVSVYFVRYGPDPDAYREHFATGGPRNFTGYSSPEFDRIVDEARQTTDLNQRKSLYFRIQEMLVRDKPYINLFIEGKVSLVRAGWDGFSVQEKGYNKSMSWFGYYAVEPKR